MTQTHFTLTKAPFFDKELERLKATPKEIEREIRNELISTAVFIRNQIIKSMRKSPKKVRINPRNGRGYWWLSGGKVHTPSSPGFAPRVDTGDLIKSILMDVRAGEVEVGSNLKGKDGKYPIFLEFGTDKMEARPWIRPAYEDAKREMMASIMTRIKKTIRQSR